MEFLIDRKFWNLVIKKLSPSTALLLKSGFKKSKSYSTEIKIDFILRLPSEVIEYGFFRVNVLVVLIHIFFKLLR